MNLASLDRCIITDDNDLGLLLLTWFNFDPDMDK